MTTSDPAFARYLEVFAEWLRVLGEDAGELAGVLAAPPSEAAARYAASGLNYIFKSLDLIPDGIDDLGFCDDAFVIRVAARLACEADAKIVEEFLAADYPRLAAYVQGLERGAVRGRTAFDIASDEAVRASFLHEVAAWSKEYQVPSFTRDVKTLIKLQAFLNAKLA
jgi:uncharacterized membrane protein YkvA (DUF1232 family)